MYQQSIITHIKVWNNVVDFIVYYLVWNNVVNVIVYYLLILMYVWIFILYNSFRITCCCYPIASDLTPSKSCKLLAALDFTYFAQSFVVTSSIFHPLQYRWRDRVYKFIWYIFKLLVVFIFPPSPPISLASVCKLNLCWYDHQRSENCYWVILPIQ